MSPQRIGLVQLGMLEVHRNLLVDGILRELMDGLRCRGIPSGVLRCYALSEVVQVLLKLVLHVLDHPD